MLKYYSGEKPEIGDHVADGLGSTWLGVVIKIHGPEDEPPFELDDGDSIQVISEALIIQYANLKDPVVDESPQDELILISRRKNRC